MKDLLDGHVGAIPGKPQARSERMVTITGEAHL
jgi:hypothetical protein